MSGTALIIGASRGLGLALVGELLARGWRAVATVRGSARTPLHDLAARPDGLTVETVDMTNDAEIETLHDRLEGRTFDLFFVNGAITRGDVPIGEVSRESFVEVLVTNAYAPMRLVERFHDLVPATGTIGVMSSRQGSISLNTNGGHEVYRASKSALNQLMRGYAARHSPRALLLINPGHVRTELGGPGAKLAMEESIPGVVDTITAHAGEPGLQFLDYRNEVVPW
ncbi:MAG: SDR family NAD(P)-dependent oxidoreductase [Pseudonocardia sp.]|nr:SDR family NAD(P)-dependent oxidoreductase [Pseudonocardia sp.]